MSELRKALEQAMSSSDEADEREEPTSVIDPPENVIKDQHETNETPDTFDVDDHEQNDKPNAEPKAEKTDDAPAEQQASSSSKAEKPPVGWSPETREHWAKLPPNVRQQISKREQEVNKLLQDTSDARKLHNEFSKTVEPYRSLMASQGINNPLQAVNGLLETAAALSMGNKQQKAQRLAGLIEHYGIDIETLDNVLAGSMPESKPDPNHDIENIINQRLAPYEQAMQQDRYQQEYAVKQRAAVSVDNISRKEFFEDVRMDMADIIELATKRGQQITMEQAYERATMLNPEIQKVVRSRQNSADLSTKQNAASSIRGNLSNVPDDKGSLDLRAQLEANWNAKASGRA